MDLVLLLCCASCRVRLQEHLQSGMIQQSYQRSGLVLPAAALCRVCWVYLWIVMLFAQSRAALGLCVGSSSSGELVGCLWLLPVGPLSSSHTHAGDGNECRSASGGSQV